MLNFASSEQMLSRVMLLRAKANFRPMLAVTGSGPLWSSQDPSLDNPRYRPDPLVFPPQAITLFTGVRRVTPAVTASAPGIVGCH